MVVRYRSHEGENLVYHGAKNSTRMRGSGFTEDSKVVAVRLKTSEAASAATRAARATGGRKESKRIAGDEEVRRQDLRMAL